MTAAESASTSTSRELRNEVQRRALSALGGEKPRSTTMKPLNTVLLASAFLAGGVLAAAGQSSTSPGSSGPSGSISAATHCKDAQGKVQLKTASSGAGTSGSAATGSGSSGTTGAAPSGSATSGMSGSTGGTGSGSMSGSSASSAAVNLPPC